MQTQVKRAFYDFSVAPFSYDFVSFLVCARAYGCTQVVFVPGTRWAINEKGEKYEYQKCTVEEQERRLKNIMIPLCADAVICPNRESAKALWHEDCFPPKYTVDDPTFAHMLGHVMQLGTLWPMNAPAEIMAEVAADVGQNPVVISMRATPYRENRNSNEDAWIRAGRFLAERGENVWFVPDTAQADKVYPVGRTYPKAAISVLHRLALSNTAKLHIGAMGGNMIFSFYSKHPALFFKPIVEGSNEASPEFWARNCVPKDSQLPWFTNLQRIVWWGGDDYDHIVATLKQWYAAEVGKPEWPRSVAPKFPMRGVVSNEVRSENVRVAMQQGHPALKHCGAFHEKRLAVACYGPSLKDTWRDLKHPILSVSGAHDFLIERGVIPDYHVECDPREYKLKAFEKPHPHTHYLLASCVHPRAWEILRGHKVTIWHLHNGPGSEEYVRRHDPVGEFIGGGSTVGTRALEVAARLGFKRYDIHGMDSSFSGEDRHAGVHHGKVQNRFEIQVGDGRKFWTSPQMKEAAEEFIALVTPRVVIENGQRYMEKNDIDIRMFGDGLLPVWYAATMEKYAQLNEPEHWTRRDEKRELITT